MRRLAVYFSQSWRARDVDLNLRVWSELAPKCELLVDEPKAASADPPYYINRIEELMRRADLFMGVLTLRPQASGPQCSPYMLFELRLAERVDLPRLVLYERETGFRLPQNVRPWECYAPFQRGENDSVMDHAEWEKRLLPQIRAWADWCERHRLPADYRASTTAVLLLGKDSEAAAIGEVRQALELYYDRILDCDPATQTSDKVFRSLREAGFVATSDLSAPLYAAAHMTGIPAIRLVRGEAGTPLPWIVRFGPGGYEEDILYWTSAEGFAAKVEPRVQAMFRLSVAKSDGADLAYLMSKRYRDFLVFVSHNLKPPEDILVRRLCQMLQSKHIPAFEYNECNKAGVAWRPAMEEALSRMTHFVALVSDGYVNSPTCTMEVEAVLARGNDVTIIPFRLKGRDSPHPRLTGSHNERLLADDPDENAAEIMRNIAALLDAKRQGK